MLTVRKLGNPVSYYTMMKLRTAAGLALLLFMATMIGGPVRVSHAQDDGGVTLASLAGKFAARGSGSLTLCFNAGHTALQDCATAPLVVPYNFARIEQETRDAAGNSCGVPTVTSAPVAGTTTTGAVLAATGTQSFRVSDSGNRIETILTSISYVPSSFSIAGSIKETVAKATSIRQFGLTYRTAFRSVAEHEFDCDASLASRKYLYTGKLSFSACLAENPGWM